MIRTAAILAAALLALSAGSGAAQDGADCAVTGGPDSCVRVFACLGDDGRWFGGRAIGSGSGTIEGTANDGVACTGTWAYSTESDYFGTASFACDDGLEGDVVYHATDPATGTAFGEGTATDGTRIRVWSGEYVLDYLRQESDTPRARLPCMSEDEYIASLGD